MNEKTNLSSTHGDVNHPSRAGVLPDMLSSDVAVGSEHTEEYLYLLCTFHLSFIFSIWSGTTFLLRCTCSLLESMTFVVLN